MIPRAIDKLGFDVVHGCQLRCIGCPNSTLKPKIRQIAVADFGRALRNIDVAHVGLFRLFNFGEPLLHDDLPDILAEIPRQAWRAGTIEISTNAQYHDFPLFAAALRTGVLTRLVVSCDGDGTPADYERLRPPGKWEKLIEFMARMRELRDRHAPRLALMTRTICTDPAAQERWRRILAPLGWIPEFRDWQYLPESQSNMLGRELRVPAAVCSFVKPGNRLYVDWDGTVVPCCVHPAAGNFGNLLSHRYSELLAGTRRIEFMGRLHSARAAMPICNRCEY